MSSSAEPKKAEETQAGSADHSGAQESQRFPPAKWVEKGLEKSLYFIKGITGFFWRRIQGIFQGVWEATGGQVTGEIKEAAKRLGYEPKEQGIFANIGNIIEQVIGKVGKVVGGTVDYTVGLPGRVLGRPLRGVQTIINSLLGKQKSGVSNTPAETHGAGLAHATTH